MLGAMTKGQKTTYGSDSNSRHMEVHSPSLAQRRWLALGVSQPGGKLPLFDRNGREVGRRTIDSCIAKGWAEPWFFNPIKPDWLVCKLTKAGFEALDEASSD